MARPRQTMPVDVRRRLEETDLADAYAARPFYQRNDYLAWIKRAKRPNTRERRLSQMIEELELGGLYMGMEHNPSRKA